MDSLDSLDVPSPQILPHSTNSWGDQPPSNLLPYGYRSLAESEIRLLVLLPGKDDDPVRCCLQHVSLPARPVYETISYCWGDPTITSTIECEGRTIQVTTNLHLALQHIRYEHDERVIWADAACINQRDLAERSAQVSMMGEIYTHSHQVVVWLGEEQEGTSQSIDQVEKLNNFFLENEEGYPNDPDRWDINHLGGSQHFVKLRETKSEWETPIANLARTHWFVRR